jgi:pimeloyl-ACP methyl ester carboxylesterase
MRCRLVFVMLAFAMMGLANHQHSRPFDQAAYVKAQRLVNIGDRRLNLYCTGKGTPTVVLDAGLGDTTISWRYVQPAIARRSRVCSYDRAGMGYSDAGPLPRTSSAIVSDLHRLLGAANVPPPYILVGHSFGSFNVRLFTDIYRADVVGMVLIDPSNEDQGARFAAAVPAFKQFEQSQGALNERCLRALSPGGGGLPPHSKLYDECVGPPDPSFGLALVKAQERLSEQRRSWQAIDSEYANVDTASAQELRHARRAYGSLPLVVLTAGNVINVPGFSDEADRKMQHVWTDLHDQLAKLSTIGSNTIVPRSGHYIQIDQPDVVITSVERVLWAARRNFSAITGFEATNAKSSYTV